MTTEQIAVLCCTIGLISLCAGLVIATGVEGNIFNYLRERRKMLHDEKMKELQLRSDERKFFAEYAARPIEKVSEK